MGVWNLAGGGSQRRAKGDGKEESALLEDRPHFREVRNGPNGGVGGGLEVEAHGALPVDHEGLFVVLCDRAAEISTREGRDGGLGNVKVEGRRTLGLCQTQDMVLSFSSSHGGRSARGTSSPSETMEEASLVALQAAIQEL